MIKDFLAWAFYNNIIGKPTNAVYKSYLIYCKLFGITDVLENKQLQLDICNITNTVILNNKYQNRNRRDTK